MVMDPLAACGMVMAAVDADGPLVVTGSCFLFRSDRVAATAAHCIPPEVQVATVYLPRLGKTIVVESVVRHPTADVALLFLDAEDSRSVDGYPATAFWDGVGNWGIGEDVMAYGFPAVGEPVVNVEGKGGLILYPPRLFKPYFQRFLDYTSPNGFRYLAGELSIPAPGGLSGSPLFRPGAPQMVVGLVTANAESYAITDSIEEVDDKGHVYRQESRKVVSFGLSLMLSGVAEWLNVETPPRPDGTGWVLK